METNRVNCSFGARFGYVRGNVTRREIAINVSPQAKEDFYGAVAKIKSHGDDKTVRHLAEHVFGDNFSLTTQVKKHHSDKEPVLSFKSFHAKACDLVGFAQKQAEALTLAAKHNVAQHEVNAVGIEHLADYVKLGELES